MTIKQSWSLIYNFAHTCLETATTCVQHSLKLQEQTVINIYCYFILLTLNFFGDPPFYSMYVSHKNKLQRRSKIVF